MTDDLCPTCQGYERDELTDEPCPTCHPKPPAVYSVAVYLVDRAYGGPEEGGWWYTCGTVVLEPDMPLPAFFLDENQALERAEALNQELDRTVNVGRRPISSVLSEGQYEARVVEGLPADFPVSRPFYQ